MDLPFVKTDSGDFNVNEDRHFVDTEIPLYAVLDGEFENGYAAELVKKRIEEHLNDLRAAVRTSPECAEKTVVDILSKANEQLIHIPKGAAGFSSGTTVTLCCVVENELVVAHIGDSRLYILKDDVWAKVTRDHTLAADNEAAGVVLTDRIEKSWALGVVTRVIGFPGPNIDIHRIDIQGVSKILLCTDGIWKSVDEAGDAKIFPLLKLNEEIGKRICDAVREKSFRENSTIIVASI